MADAKLTALSEVSVPDFADLLYTVDDTGPTSDKLTVSRALGNWLPSICQFRLTTETGVPVSTSDRTAQGTLFCTPTAAGTLPMGNRVALYDGTRWKMYVLTEKSLALTVTSGKNYDVFLDDNSGTPALQLSAAWTNDTTRADALAVQDGVTVKSGTPTSRWLGTIRASGSNVTEDSFGGSTSQVGGKRFVWNAYNQVRRHLLVKDTTDSWSYTSATVRQANAAAGNKVEYVTGDAGTVVRVAVCGIVYIYASNANAAKVGLGLDSTTTFTGMVQGGYNASVTAAVALYAPITGSYAGNPGLGYHALNWNESGSDGTNLFLGDNGGDGQQSGLIADIFA